jgi:hypothetical protein
MQPRAGLVGIAATIAAGAGGALAGPAGFGLSSTPNAAAAAAHRTKCGEACRDKKLFKQMAKTARVAYASKAGSANTANSATTADNARTALSAQTAGSATTATSATTAGSATTATTATTAGNANQVGGQSIKAFKFSVANNAASQTIVLGNLTLSANCNNNVPNPKLAATGTLTGILTLENDDETTGTFARVDRGFGSSSQDSLDNDLATATGGAGTAEATLSDQTTETLEYGYVEASGVCTFWGRAIYG